jgi:hypothetical protein
VGGGLPTSQLHTAELPPGGDTHWRTSSIIRSMRARMPDDSLNQPHDKLFKATFSDPVNAAAFLRHHLGGPLPSLVDCDSLAL